MIYRDYGKTGKKVSLIGMGTSRLNSDNNKFVENVDLVLKAVDLGINYFDTAPTYASGASERILGEAFSRINKKIYVSTKSMISMESTADEVLKRIEASIKQLHVDKIDFYHMWSILDIEQYKKIIEPGGPFVGAKKAQEQGMIEHICFSAHCNGDEAIAILNDGLFDGITLGFNALNFRYRINALKEADKMKLGIAIMNPLGGGLIPKNQNYFNFLQQKNQTVTESALLFVASHKEVTTLLVGVDKEKDLLDSVRIISENDLFSEQKLSSLYYSASVFLDNSLCTACGYCDGCPANLPISKLMTVYNEYLLSKENAEHYRYMLRMQFNFSPFETFDCIQCSKCEKQCTQHLHIMERIAKINILSKQEMQKWKNIIDEVIPDTKCGIGIYGISRDAENLIECYMTLHKKIDFPIAFFDSNSAKWGKRFMDTDYIIQSPDEIYSSKVKRIIITAKKYYKQIKLDLQNRLENDVEILHI